LEKGPFKKLRNWNISYKGNVKKIIQKSPGIMGPPPTGITENTYPKPL